MDILNEIDHDLQKLQQLAIAFLVLAWLAGCLRFYVRARILRNFSWDDWATVVTLICWTCTCAIACYMVDQFHKMLYSNHILDTNKLKIVSIDFGDSTLRPLIRDQLIRAATSFYILTMIFLKVSLGFFFLKLFVVHTWQRYAVHFLAALSTAIGIVYFVMELATCGATPSFLPTGENTCEIEGAFTVISIVWSAINVVTDFSFCGLAVMAIWSANIPRPAKISASLILVFGTCGGIASCIRLGFITRHFADYEDTLKGAITSGIWTLVEAGIGVTAASLATLRPLLRSCMQFTKTRFSTIVSCSRHNSHDLEMGTGTKATGTKAHTSVLASELNNAVGDHVSPPMTLTQTYNLQTHGILDDDAFISGQGASSRYAVAPSLPDTPEGDMSYCPPFQPQRTPSEEEFRKLPEPLLPE